MAEEGGADRRGGASATRGWPHARATFGWKAADKYGHTRVPRLCALRNLFTCVIAAALRVGEAGDERKPKEIATTAPRLNSATRPYPHGRATVGQQHVR